ncbi:MAG: hypothetical protein ABL982_04385 [Vicinamibacterales bacterium]
MRGCRFRSGLVIPLVLLCAAPVEAQSRLGNGRTVLAAVVNERGLPVVDVGLDDFVVTEGDDSRDVLDVHVADYPLAVVIDDRPATLASATAVRAAARRFIQRVGERPVALLRLTDGAHPLATLDDERPAVLEALSGLAAAASEAMGPLDTIARAAGILQQSGAPFSAVVVIAAANIDASMLVRGELLPAIITSGAAVHVVQAQTAGEASTDGTATDLLRVVADQTRGQFTAIYSAASYAAALDRLADRLAIELMVQYLVPEGERTGDVRVGVRRPGARVVGLGVK